MKIKAGLMNTVVKTEKEEKKQDKLKEKHKIEDENVVVVEKGSTTKYLVLSIRSIASILFYFFAIIGIISLIYPASRNALFDIYKDTIGQLFLLLKGN